MDKRTKKATIIEVARLAGVSTATAGRVLGSYGYASTAIQKKVRDAADTLAYRPNRLARGFKTGRTQTIGVVVGDIESPFYASILRGIADEVRGRGFGVLVTNSDENVDREREAVQLLLEKQVDGLIVSPAAIAHADCLSHAIASQCPVVQVDRVVRGLETDAVLLDNVGSAHHAVTQLIDAGHRRIGIVAELVGASPKDISTFVRTMKPKLPLRHLYPSWQRLLGYLLAHREAGLNVDASLVRKVNTYSISAAKSATEELLSQTRPTALFTADGLMSTGAMMAIAGRGLRIPNDLSLVCFDDLDWMKFIGTGISAISQPANQMGVAVAELLMRRIDLQPGPPEHRILLAEFVARGSIVAPV